MKNTSTSLFKNLIFLSFFLFTIGLQAQPTITSVKPSRVTTGSTVTITGTNLTMGTVVVRINNNATGFSVVTQTATQIVLNISGSFGADASIEVRETNATPSTVFSETKLRYVTPVSKSISSGANNVRINKIYTDYNGFWASSSASSTPAQQPNTSHNLLGFEYNGKTYSTGVNDAKLTANGVTSFISQYYRAFSTEGVLGKTHGELFLATADLIDGTAHTALGNPGSPNIAGLTSYDVLVDGINGLDLGTGVTNFNKLATVNFKSNNAQAGTGNIFLNDNKPDVILTQIALPNNVVDVYYFKDIDGNVVGTPILLNLNNFDPVGTYRLDLFTFQTGINIEDAVPVSNRVVDSRTRDIRMVGLDFEDFGITASNAADIANVYSIAMNAGGGADLAFMAYNTESFKIQSPNIVSAPNPVNICKLPYNPSVTFSVSAGVDNGGNAGTLQYQWKKNNISIPGATSNSYTISGPIDATDFATYKVEIKNENGAIVATSAVLKGGGIPAVWNGTSWNNAPTSTSSLIFTANYNTATSLVGTELQGCDCKINNDVEVTIASGDTMILQNFVQLEPYKPAQEDVDNSEVCNCVETIDIPEQFRGELIVEDKGSLVQINETASNIGEITYKRKATNLQPLDYVYWSSPVENFDVSKLSSYPTPMYFWDPLTANSNGTFGNWVPSSGTMERGKGYISNVADGNDFTVTFSGKPNNGIITQTLSGTQASLAIGNESDENWNLIGNPYPSPIDAEAFLLANKAIDGVVTIWSHESVVSSYSNPFYQNYTQNYNPGDYILFNGTASIPAGFDGYIASGQGFFVQLLSNSGTVTFNNLLRYKSGSSAYDNGQFYRASMKKIQTNVEKSVVWLGLINPTNGAHSNIAVGYIADATYEKDRMYDATNTADQELLLYSLLDNNEKLSIQGRPAPLDVADSVLLGFSAPSSGSYKIVIDQLSGVFKAGQNIYLEDKFLNIIHDLKAAPYDFTTIAGSFNDRFNLRYTNTLGVNTTTIIDDTVAYINGGLLHVNATNELEVIKIYDLTGKLLSDYSLKEDNIQAFSKSFQHAKGVYLVQINFKNGITITKKLKN